jgi:NAD(P)-dependent dehydrogenase (short-subunit alcohol dehydrogenase family)
MDKKLLIFGANGALGKGVTKVLMQKDYNEIILFGTKSDSEITDTKVKQVIIKDLSDEQNVAEAFINIRENPKTNFYLFSTIGGYYGGLTTWETEEIDFDRMIKMNLKANYLITKKFAEIVKGSNGGSICLTSAYTSIKPEALKFAYGASKSALNYLVKVMALEGERINLSINAIAPLIIDTPANREWMKDANYTSWVKPEEIGELINSLFDNYNFVSGNILELKSRFMK